MLLSHGRLETADTQTPVLPVETAGNTAKKGTEDGERSVPPGGAISPNTKSKEWPRVDPWRHTLIQECGCIRMRDHTSPPTTRKEVWCRYYSDFRRDVHLMASRPRRCVGWHPGVASHSGAGQWQDRACRRVCLKALRVSLGQCRSPPGGAPHGGSGPHVELEKTTRFDLRIGDEWDGERLAIEPRGLDVNVFC